MDDIQEVLLKLCDKKSSGGGIKNENMPDQTYINKFLENLKNEKYNHLL